MLMKKFFVFCFFVFCFDETYPSYLAAYPCEVRLIEYFHCSIRAVICLNLSSYGGGRNPWGQPKPEYLEKVCILFRFIFLDFLCYESLNSTYVLLHMFRGILLPSVSALTAYII